VEDVDDASIFIVVVSLLIIFICFYYWKIWKIVKWNNLEIGRQEIGRLVSWSVRSSFFWLQMWSWKNCMLEAKYVCMRARKIGVVEVSEKPQGERERERRQ